MGNRWMTEGVREHVGVTEEVGDSVQISDNLVRTGDDWGIRRKQMDDRRVQVHDKWGTDE